jgi:hypothetical protein
MKLSKLAMFVASDPTIKAARAKSNIVLSLGPG